MNFLNWNPPLVLYTQRIWVVIRLPLIAFASPLSFPSNLYKQHSRYLSNADRLLLLWFSFPQIFTGMLNQSNSNWTDSNRGAGRSWIDFTLQRKWPSQNPLCRIELKHILLLLILKFILKTLLYGLLRSVGCQLGMK